MTDLAVHRTDNRVIYAATVQAGVFISPDQADGWLNLGTPTNSVHAEVTTDLGNRCLSIGGADMMVVPAGIFDLYAVADNYGMGMAEDITVVGGDVTRHDFALRIGNTVTHSGGDVPHHSSDGGAYCFIHASAH